MDIRKPGKPGGHKRRVPQTRRDFLKTGLAASTLAGIGSLHPKEVVDAAAKPKTLLKNGLIVDGSGKPGFVGDVLVSGTRIEAVSEQAISAECAVVDCSGKVVAPGFIDMHSHMDWVLPIRGHSELKSPFTRQGITTFVAGNCGFSPGGFRKNSEYKGKIQFTDDQDVRMDWDTMEGYFDHLEEVGMSHNLITCVGHGTTRASMRASDPSPLSTDEMQEMLALVEEALDDGACGVSFGLQYAPGIFAPQEEVTEVARVAAKKGKMVTVHGRAYSCVSGAYKIDLAGKPHNIIALQEMLDVARKTGVRLQYSHLMFAGTASWPTCEQCLELLDQAIAEGVDVMIDTYPYHCGTSVINVVIPPWFQANLPENYHNEEALKRLEGELTLMSTVLGFGYDNIQVTDARHPQLNQYNGLFLSQIAEKRGMKPFDVAMEISEKSNGRARVLNHNYSNMEVIEALIKYPRCLFMTDATPAPKGVQNPAVSGAFPLLLQYARDRKLLTLEEAVRKMTGANAERAGLKGRGFVKPGYAADLTVFDWKSVKDNNTLMDTDNAPSGIETVFINGQRVLANGKVDVEANAGVAFRA